MVIFKQTGEFLIIGHKDKIIMQSKTNHEAREIEIPKINQSETNSMEQNSKVKYNVAVAITCMALSPCDKMFAICCQDKRIFIYDINLQLFKTLELTRTASKLCFGRNRNLFVADKTGDAYVFNIDDEFDIKGNLLLGHLSVLLDLALSDNNDYIITCDRDEKIRVSQYPNSYNVEAFCLGHEEFVTHIEISHNVLISASGDGTIKFWEYKTGNMLKSVNTNEVISDQAVIKCFCDSLAQDKFEAKALPISEMQVSNVLTNTIIVLTLYQVNCVFIYLATISNDITITYRQKIDFSNLEKILAFSLYKDFLYIILSSNIFIYHYSIDKFNLVDNDSVVNLYNKYKDFLNSPTKSIDSLVTLYKKKFDNVQEYLDRKKRRLEIK